MPQRQQLLRLLIEDVHVTGWQVKIRLRIPLDPPDPGPRYLFSLIGSRALMQGFIISDHLALYPEFLAEVGGWLKTGRIKGEETVVEGIENAPKAFLGLFSGDNLGKMVVRLAPDTP